MGLHLEEATNKRICHMAISKRCKGIKPDEKCLVFRGYRVTENYCKHCIKELTRKL
jgi:hypothetical protein